MPPFKVALSYDSRCPDVILMSSPQSELECHSFGVANRTDVHFLHDLKPNHEISPQWV
jgi:hypothetical protein